jgi:hypothetical protein
MQVEIMWIRVFENELNPQLTGTCLLQVKKALMPLGQRAWKVNVFNMQLYCVTIVARAFWLGLAYVR